MIDILGFKRLVILLVLIVVNVILGYAAYIYIQPNLTKKDRELSGVRGQVSTLSADIDRMSVEFEQLEQQQEQFQALLSDGFFKKQSRRQAERLFNKIQEMSGVTKAIVNVKSGEILDDENAGKANHKILSSPVDIRIEAVDDVDIMHYLFLIKHYFPGHMAVQELTIKRNADVTGTVIRGIISGKNPALVEATAEMVWKTMIPDEEKENQAGGQ